jgi:hypothetical protein
MTRITAFDLARRRGFSTMRLDTGDLQTEAQALYTSLGFVPIPPYYECPDRLRKHLVFMELLSDHGIRFRACSRHAVVPADPACARGWLRPDRPSVENALMVT